MTQECSSELLLTVSMIQHRVPRRTLSTHQALHSIVQHNAIAGVCRANSVWIFRICAVSTTNLYSIEVAIELAPFAL
jgi:hypothetical protein